jgi:hypothetical protein
MNKFVVASLTLVLASCGGGGSDGEQKSSQPQSASSAPVSSITVSLNSNLLNVMEGSTYTLTWSSSNATNCVAEGSWTGTVSVSGNKELTAAGVGDKTYKITCNNSTGSASSSVLVKITENVCVNPHKNIKYPETYVGNWPIPQPTKTIPKNITKMIALKDYHEAGDSKVSSAIFDNRCAKDWYAKLMLTNTLDRVKALGTQRIWLYNYSPWTNVNVDVMTVHKPRQQYSDEMVKFVVEEANKRGIEVYYSWMFDLTDINNNWVYQFNTKIDDKTFRKMLDSYSAHMREHVKFLESIGVKGVTLDWTAMYVLNHYEHRSLMYGKLSTLADDIRKNFSGKILLNGSSMIHSYDAELFGKVDYLISPVIPQISESELQSKSTAAIKRAVRCQLSLTYLRFTSNVPKDGRCIENPEKSQLKLPPIHIEMLVQSRDRYLTEGWVEDGFCVSGKRSDGTVDDCIQLSYVTDFSSQAFVTNVILEELMVQSSFYNITTINAGHYWHTDEILGTRERGFPNLSQSVRGKPAEEVIRYWFSN